ncbi:MAG: hypothetical protein ABIR71_00830 [Chthoniobacterales bacterium]
MTAWTDFAPGANFKLNIGITLNTGLPIPSQVVSRKLHAGVPYDINLPLGSGGTPAVECRSGGANGDFQLVYTFPEAVTFSNAAVSSGPGSVSNSSGSGSDTVTVDLTGVTNAQRVTVTLSSVNNGTSTADFAVQMGVLLGDATGNGSVNGSDVGQVKSQSGQTLSSLNFRSDVNVSGAINGTDVGQTKLQTGTNLP